VTKSPLAVCGSVVFNEAMRKLSPIWAFYGGGGIGRVIQVTD
jgi:hypothetical protein